MTYLCCVFLLCSVLMKTTSLATERPKSCVSRVGTRCTPKVSPRSGGRVDAAGSTQGPGKENRLSEVIQSLTSLQTLVSLLEL